MPMRKSGERSVFVLRSCTGICPGFPNFAFPTICLCQTWPIWTRSTAMPYFIGDLLELPLTTTQDYSLFHILQQRSLDLWKKQIAMIQQRYGLVSFIVHPDYVTEKWASELYNDLLAYLSELRSSQGMWIALPRDVADWWKARRQMKLVQQGGAWKIEGPQAERARIAYASLGANGVQFRVEKAQPIAVAR